MIILIRPSSVLVSSLKAPTRAEFMALALEEADSAELRTLVQMMYDCVCLNPLLEKKDHISDLATVFHGISGGLPEDLVLSPWRRYYGQYAITHVWTWLSWQTRGSGIHNLYQQRGPDWQRQSGGLNRSVDLLLTPAPPVGM